MKTMLRVIFSCFFCFPLAIYANTAPNPDVYFDADSPTEGCGPLTVLFSDWSNSPYDPIVGWSWDFGDGDSSTDPYPSHEYTVPGVYTVTLEITTQSNWKGTFSRPSFIKVGESFSIELGDDMIVCTGTPVTLDATTSGATYLWNDNSTDPELTTYFPGEYSVIVTKDGCEATDMIYVDHAPNLYADIDYVIDPSNTCTPVKTDFIPLTQMCSGTVVEWSWDFGDGHTSDEANPSHEYLMTGDFDVTLTVKKDDGSTFTTNKTVSITGTNSPVVNLGNDFSICGFNMSTLSAGNTGADYLWSTGETSEEIYVFDAGEYFVEVTQGGCVAKDTVNVTWQSPVTSDFSFTKQTACLPVKYKFTDLSTSCEGNIVGWLWQFGDGHTSTDQYPEHEFATDGEFPVRLQVTNDLGSSISRTIKVTVTSISMSVDLGSDTTICFGESLTLAGGNPGADFAWSTGETTQDITVMDEGEYFVEISQDGCIAKDTIQVYSSAAVVAKWGYKVTGACLPVSVAFRDSSEAFCGKTVSAWKWEFGDGDISYEQHPTHEYLSEGSFVVRLTATSSGGVTTTRSLPVVITNTLHTLNLPELVKICRGDAEQLDAGVVGAQYSWTPSFGLNSSDIRNPVVTPNMSGWYSVDVTKCMVTVTDSIYVALDSIMKPAIAQESNLLRAPDAASYQWYRDGTLLPTGTSKTLRADKAGYYKVKVFNELGCFNESDPFFFMPVSGKDGGAGDGIRVKCTPNPTHGDINILLSAIPSKPAQVSVHDANGRKILSTTISGNINKLKTAGLSKGLYFVEVVINGNRKMISVVIQ